VNRARPADLVPTGGNPLSSRSGRDARIASRGRTMVEEQQTRADSQADASIPFRHVAVDGPIGRARHLSSSAWRGAWSRRVYEDVQNRSWRTSTATSEVRPFAPRCSSDVRYEQLKNLAQGNLFQPLVLTDYTFAKDKIFAYLNLDDAELRVYDRLYALLASRSRSPTWSCSCRATRGAPQADRVRGQSYERRDQPRYLRDVIEAYNYYYYTTAKHRSWSSTPTTSTSSTGRRTSTTCCGKSGRPRAGPRHYVPLRSRKGRSHPLVFRP